MKHKKRLSRRFMAFLLTAVLVFSSLSLSAFAGTSDDESADAEDAVVATETVTASEDDTAAAETEEDSSDDEAEQEEAEEESSEDDVLTVADEDTDVSVTVDSSTTITVSGSYQVSDLTFGNDYSTYISVSTSVSTTVTAGTKYESLSSNDSFYISYTENGTTYYLVLSVSSGMGGNSSLTVSYTTDISQATLITYSTANSGSGGYLSFTSGETTYYLGVSSSNGGPSGYSTSLTASTSASTTWSYSSSTGFSTSVTTNSGGNQDGQGQQSTTTTYYLSATGLSSSASTYDYAISYSTSSTTTITITGVSAGTTTITVGETTYSITVTASSTGTQPDGDGSDASGELDANAYRSDALVYWDVNHKYNSTSSTFGSTHASTENGSPIVSVTFGTTSTTDDDGNTTETGNNVTLSDSTDSDYGSSNNKSSLDWCDKSTVELSEVYADTENGKASEDDIETLTITPADGYYVSAVYITCSAYVDAQSMYVSPYNCSTYKSNESYEGTFTLSDTTGSDLSVEINVASIYFAHNGYLPGSDYRTYTYDDDENIVSTTYNYEDGVQAVYFILIEVEKIPTPAYVEYDFGEILEYIKAEKENGDTEDEEDEDDDSESVFASADKWTDASNENVYSDDQNSDDNTSGTQGGFINGGVLTQNTQFEYVYQQSEDEDDTTDDETETADDEESESPGYESWVHYTNTISDEAIEEAAAAGYVFAGWAVTYYSTATATEQTDSSAYNKYSIEFSNASANYTTLIGEDQNLTIIGNVRLVAQWVAIEDITQVIDYGLPVSTDVEEEISEDFEIKALTDNVTSRTSVTENLYEDYENSDYVDYSEDVDFSVTGFVTKTSDEGEDESGGTSGGDSTEDTETQTADEDADSEEGNDSTEDSETSAEYDYGTVKVSDEDDGEIVYTLTEQMTGVEQISYLAALTYGTGESAVTLASSIKGYVTIIPATSVYYEEDFGAVTTTSTDEDGSETSTTTYSLVTYNGKSSSGWSQTGTSENYTQEDGVVGTTDDSTYGADTSYLSNLHDSNGTSMYVCTTSGSASFSYTFTGTGTAIYGRISDDSGYLQVIVTALDEDGDTKTDDEGKTYYKTYKYIDTRVVQDVSESTTLYNIPVFDVTDLEYGTYSVTVTIAKGDQEVLNATYDEDEKEVADNKTGNYFYLDGIRIYDPIKTSTALENSEYETVYNAYNADVEAENAVINISDKLLTESDAYDEDGSFISVTDAYGNLTGYDGYFVLGPDNEVYLDGENYTLTFYMVNWSDNYHLYIGLKAPDGTAASVKIGNTTYSIGGSADCYYEITSALEEDTSSGLSNYSGVKSVYKVAITGVSGLAALSYLKVTNAKDFEIAYELNVTADNEDDESSENDLDIEADTLYMISTTAYESLLEDSEEDSDTSDPEEDEDDDSEGDTEEDPDTEDDSEGDTEEDPDTENDSDAETDPEGEDDTDAEDEVIETAFTPEKFTASISYLKLLKTATITVKTSGDVSYITVNGEKVTGRTLMGTQYFNYLASKVSSGTTYEVIAYDENDVASDPITLTAK